MKGKAREDTGTPAGRYSSDTGMFNLTWSLKNDSICFDAAAEATGWIGVGFIKRGVHIDSDMYILRRDSAVSWTIVDGSPKALNNQLQTSIGMRN